MQEKGNTLKHTPQTHLQTHAVYRPFWRFLSGALYLLSGASLVAIAASFVLSSNPPDNPLRLFRIVAALSLLPWLAVMLLRTAFTATATLQGSVLVLQQRHARSELEVTQIETVKPWVLPLPGSGLALRLNSGRRFNVGIQTSDLAAWIEALSERVHGPGDITAHPSVVYATARADDRAIGLGRLVMKFPVFALVPTLPLFRLQQVLAYGGPFGEYYQYGLGPYLLAFCLHWATTTISLVLLAAVLRVAVEAVSVVAVMLAPGRATKARRFVRRAATVVYFGSVPLMIALRLAV